MRAMRGRGARPGLGWQVIVISAIAAGAACQRSSTAPAPPSQAGSTTPPRAPGTVEVLIAYGSEKKTWLEEQIAAFNATAPKLPSGAPVLVTGKAMGSGEAVEEILAGRLRPVV